MVSPLNPGHAGLSAIGHGPCIFYTPEALPWLEANPYILESVSQGVSSGNLTHHPYLFALDGSGTLRLWCCHGAALLQASAYLAQVLPFEFFQVASNYRCQQRGYSYTGLLFSCTCFLWQHILMLSYLYYKESEAIVPDAYFDQLCVALRWRYMYGSHAELNGHIHAHLFSEEGLRGGSLHEIKEFPRMVQGAARMFLTLERCLVPDADALWV